MKISRCKSTQHPDNVRTPFFARGNVMAGDDEIEEAFYVFNQLDCREQLWDAEGKETDNFVVKKLLSRYEEFFRTNQLGKTHVLSLRIPNPLVEKADAKILLEALYSITRSYDIAKLFYGDNVVPPIVDVYVPMVSSAADVLRVQQFYDEFIIAEQHKQLDNITIKEWIGAFKPEHIRVIPLVEDKESILNSHTIATEIINKTTPEFIRFWYARSDPSVNYGNPATVLMLKVALQRLHKVQEETGVEIYPTLGCGSAPFRGNFRPDNVDTILQGYPSVQTFTIQSSFKYDHPFEQVQAAVKRLNETTRSTPQPIDEAHVLPLIEKLEKAYKEEIVLLAPLVNLVAKHIPKRRMRKLHIGLFGYARKEGDITLPRAITFTAALYSLGLPPELLSLSVLTTEEIATLKQAWKNFDSDYHDAAQYVNPDALRIFPPLIQQRIKKTLQLFPIVPHPQHKEITDRIVANIERKTYDTMEHDVIAAARVRNFLG